MSEELRFAFLVDYVTFFGMREGSVSGTLAFLINRIAQPLKRSLIQKTKTSSGRQAVKYKSGAKAQRSGAIILGMRK